MASTGKERKRRVLIVVENLPVPFDRRVWAEATTLTQANYEVSVICPKGKGAERAYEVLEGVHIYRHPLPADREGTAGYLFEYACALFWQSVLSVRVAARRGFDAIHACNPPDLFFLIAIVWKLCFRKRFLFDHHDINPEFYEAKFGKRDFFWRLLRLAERATFGIADVSIATNDSYRDIALQRGKMPSDRVFVVRSGPDLTRVRLVEPALHLKRGRKYLVGYVGVIGEPEGIDLLLRAIAYTVKDRNRHDIAFTIIGSGPELQSMITLSRALGLEDFVNFTGRIPDKELFEILSTADVCVNPDRVNVYNDKSTMNKIMEYMALAKPIVQFETTEGRRSAAGASLYASPDDPVAFAECIVKLLDDTELRILMGKEGRHRVETALAWEFEAPRLLSAYEKLFS